MAAEDSAFPFSSYSYRVILDPPNGDDGVPAGEQGGARPRAGGARSGGQGVPTLRAPLTERPFLNDPILTTRGSPRAPERRGDPALWQKIIAGASQLSWTSSTLGAPTLVVEGTRVAVEVDRPYADRSLLPIGPDLRQLLGMQPVFRFAGREV